MSSSRKHSISSLNPINESGMSQTPSISQIAGDPRNTPELEAKQIAETRKTTSQKISPLISTNLKKLRPNSSKRQQVLNQAKTTAVATGVALNQMGANSSK